MDAEEKPSIPTLASSALPVLMDPIVVPNQQAPTASTSPHGSLQSVDTIATAKVVVQVTGNNTAIDETTTLPTEQIQAVPETVQELQTPLDKTPKRRSTNLDEISEFTMKSNSSLSADSLNSTKKGPTGVDGVGITEGENTSEVKNAGVQLSGDFLDEDDDETTLWVDDLVYPKTDVEVLRAQNLFTTVVDSERIKMMPFSSMLISGCGLRNYTSLCRALEFQQHLDEDYKRRKLKEEEEEMAKLQRYRAYERGEFKGEGGTSYSNLGSQTDFSSITATTHGDTTADQRRRIEYLMGLHGAKDGGWEEDAGMSSTASVITEVKDEDTKSCGREKPIRLTAASDAMRQAQRYLQTHHIFELFQFLIVHLLSNVPENPIEFVLLILDKLLIYRSGLGMAPLHYEKKHLEQLFYLMDKMRTGFIDVQQYKTGMNTIGIKCFNNEPPLNKDGQVSKEFFLEEAYKCSCYILTNIVTVRKSHQQPKKKHLHGPNGQCIIRM